MRVDYAIYVKGRYWQIKPLMSGSYWPKAVCSNLSSRILDSLSVVPRRVSSLSSFRTRSSARKCVYRFNICIYLCPLIADTS